MNLYQYKELWKKIESFQLDDPNSTLKFSQKLAEKQQWSSAYTERVIEEYRKFILLCCISPHGASPSKAVDEAWHLHLTYTVSYWIDFCRNTLGKDIHHHPSKGGTQENHKHEDWYQQTLSLYRSTFGYNPPSDIWPGPLAAPAKLIREIPRFTEKSRMYFTLIFFVPFIYGLLTTGRLWIFSIDGPSFLLLYGLSALTITLLLVLTLREDHNEIEERVTEYFTADASIFASSKFLYGKHRAVQTALVEMMRRQLVELVDGKNFRLCISNYRNVDQERNPLIPYFLKERDGQIFSYEEIESRWYHEDDFNHGDLQQLYSFAQSKVDRFKYYGPYVFLLLIGIGRSIQGYINDKPIGHLVLEIVGATVVYFIAVAYLSRSFMTFKIAAALYERRVQDQHYYSDKVVSEYSYKGTEALNFYAEGFVLAALFAPYGEFRRWTNTTGDSSSCSSCGSGADGGAGCGGGCGGCGGGD